MADISDRITDARNAARPVTTTVSSGRTTGATTLVCSNLAGWPTASKVHFVTYQIDANENPVDGSQLDCVGIVSGSNIGSFDVIDGTDNGNSIGDIVEMLPTAAWGQDLADALMAQHNRLGEHVGIDNTGGLTTDTLVVTVGTSLPNGDIGVDDLADSSATPAKLLAGTGTTWSYTAFTPTVALTGGSSANGNAVITGAWKQTGKTVEFYTKYVVGSTTVFTGLTSVTLTLPAAMIAALVSVQTTLGTGNIRITGNYYDATAIVQTATTVLVVAKDGNVGTGTTYVGLKDITATVPGSWGVGDSWFLAGTYEGA